ncbi:hypothetical protein BX070DRAFT_131471 [Coemansia spiralis]|nr:hypothetical protein BX070DRAFT_131471 [Coemansia spiralis]
MSKKWPQQQNNPPTHHCFSSILFYLFISVFLLGPILLLVSSYYIAAQHYNKATTYYIIFVLFSVDEHACFILLPAYLLHSERLRHLPYENLDRSDGSSHIGSAMNLPILPILLI